MELSRGIPTLHSDSRRGGPPTASNQTGKRREVVCIDFDARRKEAKIDSEVIIAETKKRKRKKKGSDTEENPPKARRNI